MAGKQAFFYQKHGANHAKKSKHGEVRWADVIQSLITHGHQLSAIKDYTQRQIELFYQSIMRQHNNQKADQIEAVNLGFGGGKETAQYLKQLRNI